MMFMFGVAFIVLGAVMLSLDIMLPFISLNLEMFLTLHGTVLPLEFLGIVFVGIGVVVIGMRVSQTGVGLFMDLPSSKVVPLIHSNVRGHDPDARFMKGRRLDLEVITAKNKIFKDAGGGFRIAGHSCRRTYETIGFTVPEWLSQYLHDTGVKYGFSNSDEFRDLRKQLKELRKESFETKEQQLRKIKLLEPIMNDPSKREELLAMDFKQLRDMEECLFDGVSHNGDDVELFIDSATPNEQDVLEHQTYLNDMNRSRQYKNPGEINWGQWVPWMVFLLIGGVLAVAILKGVFG